MILILVVHSGESSSQPMHVVLLSHLPFHVSYINLRIMLTFPVNKNMCNSILFMEMGIRGLFSEGDKLYMLLPKSGISGLFRKRAT